MEVHVQVINPEIFREYDIRGIADRDLEPRAVRRLGQTLGTYFLQKGKKEAILGRDNRSSSPRIREDLLAGILSTGCNVTDIGIVVTPMFYYSAILYGINSGVMITASHNPPEFNGMKVLLGPSTIYGEEIQHLLKMAQDGQFVSGSGEVITRSPAQAYIDMISSKIRLGPRKLRVVIDSGNGTASLFACDLFSKLGCDVVPLYCESDPSFPHHFPDPVKPQNLTDLIQKVKETRADLGIAFDGDADRIGVVDDQGNIIWGDKLMALFWREILPRYPGSTAIIEVKCSQALVEEVERLGGRPMFYRTGHSLIKAKMRELGAVFTGEMSGHMFFADEYFGYDDALYAAARLLRILSNTDESLSSMLATVPAYPATPETRVRCPDAVKFDVVARVKEHFKDRLPVIDVDGARVLFDSGWGLIRASNTGPELVLRAEARTKESLEAIKREMEKALAPMKEVGSIDW